MPNTRKNCYFHHCYTSSVRVDNTWFLISDARVLRPQKLQSSSKDIIVPYILICEKITNFLTAPNQLNGTAEAGPRSELISETAETVI